MEHSFQLRRPMKKYFLIIVALMIVFLSGCSNQSYEQTELIETDAPLFYLMLPETEALQVKLERTVRFDSHRSGMVGHVEIDHPGIAFFQLLVIHSKNLAFDNYAAHI